MTVRTLQSFPTTGSLALFRYHGHFRIACRASDGAVSWFDVDGGYDAFFPDTISDEQLGAEILKALDLSRSRMQVPITWDLKVARKRLQEWHRRAFRFLGVKDLAELWGGCEYADCARDSEIILFWGGREHSPTHIVPQIEHDPRFFQNVLPVDSDARTVGQAARETLSHMIRGKAILPKW